MNNFSKREPAQMTIFNTWISESDVIGLQRVPNRLEPIWRLPGETIGQMVARALHAVRGPGQLTVYPVLRD